MFVYVCVPNGCLCASGPRLFVCEWPTGVIFQVLVVGPFHSVSVCFNVGRPNLCVCIIMLEGPVRVVGSIGMKGWWGDE